MFCSFYREGEFNPKKSLIKIYKIEEKGINIPITECDGNCPDSDTPKCVSVCPTGSLIYATLDNFLKKMEELADLREKIPVFKIIAPWRYPFPWKINRVELNET